MVDVTLLQLNLGLARHDASARIRPLEPVIDQVRRAASAGADFVVLPELWRTGPFELETTIGLAEPIDGPTARAMSAVAREWGIWLHAGSILETAADEIYNTSLLFSPSGELVAHYRKRYLFGFNDGEALHVRAGDEVVVVDTPLGPTGLATCYDLRFPEHFRDLTDAGAQTVLLTSGWPLVRIRHWDILIRARAIENQTWLLAANATGYSGSVKLGGRSTVVDPWGEAVVAEIGTPALTARIDPEAVAVTRADFPVLADRRPDSPVVTATTGTSSAH